MTLRGWALLLFVGLYFLVTSGANADEAFATKWMAPPADLNQTDQSSVSPKARPAAPAPELAAPLSSASVWDQMQQMPTDSSQGVIKSVKMEGSHARFQLQTDDGKTREYTVCSDPAQVPFDRPTETKQRVLEKAFETGDRVELGMSGPWNPCLSKIQVTKQR